MGAEEAAWRKEELEAQLAEMEAEKEEEEARIAEEMYNKEEVRHTHGAGAGTQLRCFVVLAARSVGSRGAVEKGRGGSEPSTGRRRARGGRGARSHC